MSSTVLDFQRVPTPAGEFILAADANALRRGWFAAGGQQTPPAHWRERDTALLRDARGQLKAYLRGGLRQFKLPLALDGTARQKEIWKVLCHVPWGQRTSYAELAVRIGRPDAASAVGAALARNPLLIIVPCHRVVGSQGQLTGYAGGLARKRWLLDLESQQERLFADMLP